MKINLIKKAALISFLAFCSCIPAAAPSQLHTYDYLMRVAKLVQSSGPDAAQKIIENLDALAGKNAEYNFRQILKALEIELKKKPTGKISLPEPRPTAATILVAAASAGAGPTEVTPQVPEKPTIDIYWIRSTWPEHNISLFTGFFVGSGQSIKDRQTSWKYFKEGIQKVLTKKDEISKFNELKRVFADQLGWTNKQLSDFFNKRKQFAIKVLKIGEELIQYLTDWIQQLQELKKFGLYDGDATTFENLKKEIAEGLKYEQENKPKILGELKQYLREKAEEFTKKSKEEPQIPAGYWGYNKENWWREKGVEALRQAHEDVRLFYNYLVDQNVKSFFTDEIDREFFDNDMSSILRELNSLNNNWITRSDVNWGSSDNQHNAWKVSRKFMYDGAARLAEKVLQQMDKTNQ